ncbi:MoaF-related domain-containing protein [Streptomyces sp. NPDC092296]|uniref:MoaF-related domain-containing protein n=1 Tax=Streptomyces sp. NPDC092296 TaxID=3366012 RepID=UPI00381799A0
MNRKLVSLAVLPLLATGGIVYAAQGAAAAPAPAAVTANAASAHVLPPLFAGHTYLVTMDNGNVYRNTYSADGSTLHSETVQGDGVGDSFDAPLQVVQTGIAQYFVSWVEPNGVTISHVMNLLTSTVQAYVTFGTAAGGRVGQLHSATLTLVRR